MESWEKVFSVCFSRQKILEHVRILIRMFQKRREIAICKAKKGWYRGTENFWNRKERWSYTCRLFCRLGCVRMRVFLLNWFLSSIENVRQNQQGIVEAVGEGLTGTGRRLRGKCEQSFEEWESIHKRAEWSSRWCWLPVRLWPWI